MIAVLVVDTQAARRFAGGTRRLFDQLSVKRARHSVGESPVFRARPTLAAGWDA